jgi:hypothetical protein
MLRDAGDGPIDWSQLERFPKLKTVQWAGADRGVVAARPGIQSFYWEDGAGSADRA